MSVRYDILRIREDWFGVVYYEVVDLKTGAIFWTKQVPR